MHSRHTRPILAGRGQFQSQSRRRTGALRSPRHVHHYQLAAQVAPGGRKRPSVRENAATAHPGMRRRDGGIRRARAVGHGAPRRLFALQIQESSFLTDEIFVRLVGNSALCGVATPSWLIDF